MTTNELILLAHDNLTWRVGKRDYAPTFSEIEIWIYKHRCSGTIIK